MQVAIVGIRGLPNNYGGFETLAEFLVKQLGDQIQFTVYCSAKDLPGRQKEFYGARLVYIPFSSHGASGIIYDSLSLIHAISRHDKILFLGFGGGFVMPFLKRYRSKIILNIGGLDWKREKWSGFARNVIRKAEALLIRNAGCIVSDNIGIRNYIRSTYGRESTLIAYGGDQAIAVAPSDRWTQEYPLLNHDYAFTVCRIQADNNIEMMLEAFSKQPGIPLVMVGNWDNSEYGRQMRVRYGNTPGMMLLDAIYEPERLNVLRSNCTVYIHGHSAGGTNPALAEAMYLGLPVLAFASGYNEYTTNHSALYFSDSEELFQLVKDYTRLELKKIGGQLSAYAHEHYRWDKIAAQYEYVLKDRTTC